jgi:hypothetical protein
MSGSVCRCNRYIVRSFRVHRATSWHRSTASGRRDVLERGNWRIVAEFTEIESGKRSDRPALDKALAAARVRQVPLECMVGQEGRAVRRATATAISSMGSGRCAGPCEHKFGRSGRCSERRSSEQRARRLNGPSRSGEFHPEPLTDPDVTRRGAPAGSQTYWPGLFVLRLPADSMTTTQLRLAISEISSCPPAPGLLLSSMGSVNVQGRLAPSPFCGIVPKQEQF